MLERQCSEQNTADWREWYWLCQTVESVHHHHNHNIRFSIPLWYKYIFSIFSRGNRNLSTFFFSGHDSNQKFSKFVDVEPHLVILEVFRVLSLAKVGRGLVDQDLYFFFYICVCIYIIYSIILLYWCCSDSVVSFLAESPGGSSEGGIPNGFGTKGSEEIRSRSSSDSARRFVFARRFWNQIFTWTVLIMMLMDDDADNIFATRRRFLL